MFIMLKAQKDKIRLETIAHGHCLKNIRMRSLIPAIMNKSIILKIVIASVGFSVILDPKI